MQPPCYARPDVLHCEGELGVTGDFSPIDTRSRVRVHLSRCCYIPARPVTYVFQRAVLLTERAGFLCWNICAALAALPHVTTQQFAMSRTYMSLWRWSTTVLPGTGASSWVKMWCRWLSLLRARPRHHRVHPCGLRHSHSVRQLLALFQPSDKGRRLSTLEHQRALA